MQSMAQIAGMAWSAVGVLRVPRRPAFLKMSRWLRRGGLLLLLALIWAGAAGAAPILSAANGHYCEAVARPGGITWAAADAAANARSFNGMPGHLATITSPEEQTFIVGQFPQAINGGYWLGGFQSHGILDPAAGWQWVTGEPWSYTAWGPGQPDDFAGPGTSDQDENRLHFWSQSGGRWDDVIPSERPLGYVVEYEPAAAAAPTITGYTAPQPSGTPLATAPPGALLRITGTNMGRGGTVLFSGTLFSAAVANWSATEIVLWVPTAPSYPFQTAVSVVVDGQRAEGGVFTITAPTPDQDNLLANGSFEYPDSSSSPDPWGYTYGQTDDPQYTVFGGYSIPGWRIPIGTIDVVDRDWVPAPGQGRQSIDLVGSPFPAIIAQTFYTQPGRLYVFSGWLSHNWSIPEGRADVFFNDEFFVQLHHKGHLSPTHMNWMPFSYRFQAMADQTTLAIEDVTGISYFQGTALDGLSITLASN
jgi:uncharacterized protein DUF642